jgi:hypothetical protein
MASLVQGGLPSIANERGSALRLECVVERLGVGLRVERQELRIALGEDPDQVWGREPDLSTAVANGDCVGGGIGEPRSVYHVADGFRGARNERLRHHPAPPRLGLGFAAFMSIHDRFSLRLVLGEAPGRRAVVASGGVLGLGSGFRGLLESSSQREGLSARQAPPRRRGGGDGRRQGGPGGGLLPEVVERSVGDAPGAVGWGGARHQAASGVLGAGRFFGLKPLVICCQ